MKSKLVIVVKILVPLYGNYFKELKFIVKNKKPPTKVEGFYKYSRWESNPHVLGHRILNPARLPIPPLELIIAKLHIIL